MSTIASSDQSSVFVYYFIGAIMSEKQSAMLRPKVQHPERTKKFVSVIAEALEVFEDNIGSLEENLQASAYETFINSYKDALLCI